MFVFTFVHPLNPYDDNPRYDLDRVSPSLVKNYERRHGTAFPGMTWDKNQAFDAVAAFYARQHLTRDGQPAARDGRSTPTTGLIPSDGEQLA